MNKRVNRLEPGRARVIKVVNKAVLTMRYEEA